MKKIILNSVIGAFFAIGLTACGGGGGSSSSSTKSKTDEISKREYIVITYHYPKDVCKSSYLRNELKRTGATDIVISVENGDVTCATYGKKHDYQECGTIDTGDYGEPTCVIGTNRTSSSSYYYKLTDKTLILEDIQEAIIKAF